MPQKKYIRFINSDYETLFHLPDGGRIRLTLPGGAQKDRVCQFLDEYHTRIGHETYHICEFAERMERSGVKVEPLDYIREPEFYRRHFFAADGTSKGPAYCIIDETADRGFAYAPKGAAKGRKYCIFEKLSDRPGHCSPGGVIQWGGTLKEVRPQDWGFDLKKIKAVTQRPRTRAEPER